MYDIIFHADWSKKRNKRWLAKAERRQSGWEISSLAIAPCKLAKQLLGEATDKRVLAGFDFPIGVPAKWAHGLDDPPSSLRMRSSRTSAMSQDSATSAGDASRASAAVPKPPTIRGRRIEKSTISTPK